MQERRRRADLYPSRVGGKTQVLERQDPVVHRRRPGHPEGPLRPGELTDYERRGYRIVAGLLEPGLLGAMQSELARLLDWSHTSDAPEIVREPESEAVRSVFGVHRSSPVFARVARSPLLVGIAEQVLGSSVYVHQSRLNLKPGFDGRDFWWHSDFETWHVEDGMPRMRAVSLSISLRDNRPWNGSLLVVPGSHLCYISCPGTTPEGHHRRSLRRQEHGVPDPDTVEEQVEEGGIEMAASEEGSILLFDCNLLHGSSGNITPDARSNLFLVYNSVENALGEPFSGREPRPDYVASRDFTPIAAAGS